jgi:hypothetical protein
MAHDNDQRIAEASQKIVAHLDELGSDAVALFFRHDRHRAERYALDAANSRWAVHDVTHNPTLLGRHKRQQRTAIGSQRVNDVAFLVLAERTMIHLANGLNVSGFFRSDLDHAVGCPPNALAFTSGRS